MPKISESRRQARREQIARAALEQFAVRGIHSTSMANIVDGSGLSSGAIYTHFASKDEIIAHVARTTVGGVFIGLEGLLESDPLPAPARLITLITEQIAQAEMPTGFIVQVWAEAVTNPTVRAAANEVYTVAFEFVREYATRWLSTGGGLDPRQAHTQAPRQARVMLNLIYAHILQTSLLDRYSTADFLADTSALITDSPR
ncbi:TetR/AcrR family transcriptional regulator [Kribbella solani]|uniref:AcrR family transcriptional regulator n=1 Tax=Kribbella solani TaxID=236067 RepID=A0A841E399_9ACTN|nr:TetR/AcrR family transcriptional regulator [Kribbella solani]MBB5983485.1 AcrR family transcriptional regulator [Kribbella solani]